MSNFPPRIAPVAPEHFTPEQAELVGAWSHLNFSRVLVRHPALYRVFVPYIQQVIPGSTLPPRDREVLVIRTLAICGDEYEAAHHAQIALKAGLGEADIAAAASADTSLGEWDRLLTEAADELVREQYLTDATWASLAERYSEEQIMEVVMLVGCYTVMAMVTKSFGMALESNPDVDERLKELRQYT